MCYCDALRSGSARGPAEGGRGWNCAEGAAGNSLPAARGRWLVSAAALDAPALRALFRLLGRQSEMGCDGNSPVDPGDPPEPMHDPSPASVVVAVVPREKFSYAPAALDALLADTTQPFELLYIDGNSSRSVAAQLERALAGRPQTRLLRFEHSLGPLQSRNIAIREAPADAKYLVLIDNDVLVRPGWLSELVRCAEEEQAGAVVPCVLIGQPDTDQIHYAGGDTGI